MCKATHFRICPEANGSNESMLSTHEYSQITIPTCIKGQISFFVYTRIEN